MCLFKCSDLLKAFGQLSHLNGFSSSSDSSIGGVIEDDEDEGVGCCCGWCGCGCDDDVGCGSSERKEVEETSESDFLLFVNEVFWNFGIVEEMEFDFDVLFLEELLLLLLFWEIHVAIASLNSSFIDQLFCLKFVEGVEEVDEWVEEDKGSDSEEIEFESSNSKAWSFEEVIEEVEEFILGFSCFGFIV